jgi:hypothetical protein
MVTCALELAQDSYVCGLWASPYLYLITEGDVDKIPTGEQLQCTDLIKVPGFDIHLKPYVLMRTQSQISLVNLKTHKVYSFISTVNQRTSYQKLKLIAGSEQCKLLYSEKD